MGIKITELTKARIAIWVVTSLIFIEKIIVKSIEISPIEFIGNLASIFILIIVTSWIFEQTKCFDYKTNSILTFIAAIAVCILF